MASFASSAKKIIKIPKTTGSSGSMPFTNLNSAIKKYNEDYNKLSDYQSNFDDLQQLQMQNAVSAQSAADSFNANQAALQRDFTMAMSSTAHQREVRDLQAAGLNPVLSAGGSGAPMGSAAAASSSNALTGVFGSMATTALNAVKDMAQTQLNNSTTVATNANSVNSQVYNTQTNANVAIYAAKLQAQTNLTMNQATNLMNERIAQINSLTQQQVAKIAGEYGLSQAQVHAFAQKYAADMAYDASVYGSNASYKSSIYGSNAGMKNVASQNSTTMKAVKANNEQSAMNTTGTILGNLAGSIIGAAIGFRTAGVPRTNYSYVGQI